MKKAFTLIELLIVVALIAMMVFIAVPQFSKFGKRSELSMKAEELGLLIENAHRYSQNPELKFDGMVVVLNYLEGTSSIANKATFSDKDAPWDGSSTESWQEVFIPDDMVIEDNTGSKNKETIYFIYPGEYLKRNATRAVGFTIKYDEDEGDFVNVTLSPKNTSDTTNQNFKVIIDESWD